jgi:hypothetical protein
MRHSHYGGLQGRFEGTGWEFLKRGIFLWGLLMFVFVLMPIGDYVLTGRGYISGTLMLSVGLFGLPFIYAAFKAIQWRWWVSGVRFGDVTFACDIRAKNLFGLYWKVIGWSWLIIFVLSVVISIVTTAIALGLNEGTLEQKMLAASQQWPLLMVIFLCYIIAALMATAVMRIYLIHDLTARVAALTTVHNIAAAENVSARGAAATAIGEGLADSLEIFGF